MTWLELYKLFKAECDQTHAGIKSALEKGIKLPPLEQIPSKKTFKGADVACIYFAEHRKWPLANPDVITECFGRCQIARDLCEFVACPSSLRIKSLESKVKKMDGKYSDAEMIRWVLIDYYYRAGIWADFYQERIEKD